jgi:penicillin-binding protein 1A
MPVRNALSSSINCAFARIAIALGPEKIVDMAHRLGIKKDLQPVPSITLGTQSTSVLEMAGAFSVFAADGIRHEPIFVTRVEGPDGEVLFNATTRGQQVFSPNLARTETEMLRKVITSGTGTAADIDRPAAGKTGTTDDNSDAWFVGYTPQLTTAVWMGHPNQVIPMRGVGGINVTGGSYPAQMWARFMRAALVDEPGLEFTPPDLGEFQDRGFIDERGRRVTGRRATGPAVAAPTTTVPATSAPTTPGTTTAAPTTTSPPTTNPPTTVPPTTAPGP